MTAMAGTSAIHAGYIGHFCKSTMIRVLPTTIGQEDERTWVLAVHEHPGTPPLSCICTPHCYYDRKLLNLPNFWLS